MLSLWELWLRGCSSSDGWSSMRVVVGLAHQGSDKFPLILSHRSKWGIGDWVKCNGYLFCRMDGVDRF